MRRPHESESRQHDRATRTQRVLAAAWVGILLVTLAGCVRPEPTQDAVLEEGYLAFPNATKIDEQFDRGSRGGWNPEGQGVTPDPSYLGLTYQLDGPTPPEDILTWYEEHLQAEGWTIVSQDGPSSTKLRKQIGNRYHSIDVFTLVQGSDSTYDPYDTPGEGQVATHYGVGYQIGYAR